MTTMIGFDKEEVKEVLDELWKINNKARKIEKDGCTWQTLYRLAIILELTKEPTCIHYIVEKLNLLGFDVSINDD